MIDLFAGAGGLSLGFKRAGFDPVWAVESSSDAATSYAENFGPHIHVGRIEDVHDFPQADVVVGGPPCQGFTPLGRDVSDVRRDLLNSMWEHYVRAVQAVEPKVFVLENVPQLLKSREFVSLLSRFSRSRVLKKYELRWGVLDAADYGVPQHRRRAILIGSRLGTPFLPSPTNGVGQELHRTVADAFTGLPLNPDGENLHSGRNPTRLSLDRYAVIPPGGNRFDLAERRPDLLPPCWRKKKSGSTDVFGRLWWDRPSVTIRTEFHKPEKGRYLHPSEDRPITLREAARLQSFPDGFRFEGSYTSIAKQIGNAVPPELARQVAEAVIAHLNGRPSTAGPGQETLVLSIT